MSENVDAQGKLTEKGVRKYCHTYREPTVVDGHIGTHVDVEWDIDGLLQASRQATLDWLAQGDEDTLLTPEELSKAKITAFRKLAEWRERNPDTFGVGVDIRCNELVAVEVRNAQDHKTRTHVAARHQKELAEAREDFELALYDATKRATDSLEQAAQHEAEVVGKARKEEQKRIYGELEDIRSSASGEYLPGIERLMVALTQEQKEKHGI